MAGIIRFIGKFIFIIFLFLLLFSYAMFQGGFVSWFLFFGFLPIFIYHLMLLSYPIKKWQVTRKLSHHVIQAGNRITVTIRIKRTIPFPIYYCICEELFPDTLKKVDLQNDKYRYFDQPSKLQVNRKIKKIIFPWFKRVIELPYTIEQVPRGEHQLQAIRIKTGDVFGFIRKEHIFQLPDQLVAYPHARPVHISDRVSTFEQGEMSSFAFNLKNTNVATGTREYAPGDKFSWIDWKQTARKNAVMTKEFEQEKSTDTMVVLNACYHDDMNVLAFEAAVEVSISLMEVIRKQASQVGFLSIGAETVHMPVHHDPTKKEWIRRHLTQVQPGGNQSFAVQLKEELVKMSGGLIIVLITTQMDEALKETIQQTGQRTRRVIVTFIQSSKRITEQEHEIIQQLQFEGVVINVLTEKQLIQNTIEVSVV